MKDSFLKSVEHRRSIYNLGSKEVVSQKEIIEIVNRAVKNAPSAFNSQSSRVVVLFGQNYHELWQLVLDCLRTIIPEDKIGPTKEKIASFDKGYGTILFFEDTTVVSNLQEKFPLYKDKFPLWSEQASGMLQYIIWTALEEVGLGASLQHYNPLIDDKVCHAWKLPKHWRLISQMPFGSVESPADEKSFLPLEERVKIFK